MSENIVIVAGIIVGNIIWWWMSHECTPPAVESVRPDLEYIAIGGRPAGTEDGDFEKACTNLARYALSLEAKLTEAQAKGDKLAEIIEEQREGKTYVEGAIEQALKAWRKGGE